MTITDPYAIRNLAFVAEVNAQTFCAHCGAQPIEWHNPEHVELNRRQFRIGSMAHRHYSIKAIEAEMRRCTPLCRRCHMAEDGRLHRLVTHTRPPLKTACLKGHPYDEANTYWFPGSETRPPRRACRACDREWKQRRRDEARDGRVRAAPAATPRARGETAMVTTAAHATSARVSSEMREAGMFEPLTPEGKHHRAVVKGILDHYDEHIAAGTDLDHCCDALCADEEAAWADVQRAEGWGS